MQVTAHGLGVNLQFVHTLQEQGIAGFQLHCPGGFLNTATPTAHRHKRHLMFFFESVGTHRGTNQLTAESDVRRTEMMFTLSGILIMENRMVSIHQTVRHLQFQ